MPEGDTIFRTARTLQKALAGRTVTRFESGYAHLARVDDETPIRGRTIERIESAGKHLLIVFSGGLTLRTHMRMNGEWHIYRPGERWQRPRGDMCIVIATDAFVAVAFNVPVAEFVESGPPARSRRTSGPATGSDRVGDPIAAARRAALPDATVDILSDQFDREAAIRRVRAQSGAIAEVLLDQRVIAGIGNIYKSESLFVARIHPFTPIPSLSDDAIGRVIDAARKLMLASTRGTRGRLSVYSRAGQPCRRCGTAIASRRSSSSARSTYWCPKCQK